MSQVPSVHSPALIAVLDEYGPKGASWLAPQVARVEPDERAAVRALLAILSDPTVEEGTREYAGEVVAMWLCEDEVPLLAQLFEVDEDVARSPVRGMFEWIAARASPLPYQHQRGLDAAPFEACLEPALRHARGAVRYIAAACLFHSETKTPSLRDAARTCLEALANDRSGTWRALAAATLWDWELRDPCEVCWDAQASTHPAERLEAVQTLERYDRAVDAAPRFAAVFARDGDARVRAAAASAAQPLIYKQLTAAPEPEFDPLARLPLPWAVEHAPDGGLRAARERAWTQCARGALLARTVFSRADAATQTRLAGVYLRAVCARDAATSIQLAVADLAAAAPFDDPRHAYERAAALCPPRRRWSEPDYPDRAAVLLHATHQLVGGLASGYREALASCVACAHLVRCADHVAAGLDPASAFARAESDLADAVRAVLPVPLLPSGGR